MNQFRSIAGFFRVSEGNLEVLTAQMRALSQKVPMMYAVIIIGVLGLSFTHYPYAPVWMTIIIPAVFITVCILRLFLYWYARAQLPDAAQLRKRLNTTVWLSVILSVAFVSWAIGLLQYGTSDTHWQVIVFSGITMFSNAASLMHVRPAVVSMLAGVIVPLTIAMVLSGDVVHVVTAVNLVVATVAIAVVLLDSHRDFMRMVTSSVALEKERTAAQELSVTNFELATIDSLTGLSNRRGFFQTLEQLLADEQSETSIAVGLLDLDGFKPINDIYGHPAGDQVLQEVGRRLGYLSPEVVVGRLGGDEFGLIFSGFANEDELYARGEMVCERMRIPFRMDSFSAQMSASIGLVAASPDCHDAERMIKRADHALYYAKRHANGSVVLFSPAHADQIRKSLVVERRLRDAKLEDEITLAYQTVYDTEADAVVGVEALARWTNPIIGSVPPDVFIRTAERSGQIGRLTETLFSKLLKEIADWPETIFVSFNLSAHDICSPERILKLVSIADRNGIDPKRLTFEITETAVMVDFERARESLNLLKRFGAKIALDDFGTGQSSLSYVHTLPLDRVKVDRSFIAEIETNPLTRAVVQTILDLCRNLDLECIVEGVETEGQLQAMQKMGCSVFQGFLFSLPRDGVAMRRSIVADQQKAVADKRA